jgi:hypothetical protein
MNRIAALFAALPLVAACATAPSSGSDQHSPSVIPGATLEAVAFATVDVFESRGWHVAEVQMDDEMLRITSVPFQARGIAAEYADCGISGVRKPDEGQMEVRARRTPIGVEVLVRPVVVSRDSYVQEPVTCLSTGRAERTVMVALRESFGGN